MKYRLRICSDSEMYVFRHIRTTRPYGPRFLAIVGNNAFISESGVHGIMSESFPTNTRAMFKLAAINNFLDKLKEMCSTDLNTKQ
jgi:hypothetical protein